MTSTTAEPLLQASRTSRLARTQSSTLPDVCFISALTLLALAIHGYHPWSEDGGLYAAGIKHLLNPALYPHDTPFVVGHLRFSLFAPLVALLTRASGLSLDWTLFLIYTASIWATLFTAWLLAVRLFPTRTARLGAVTLLACWLTLPLAGTSLMLMDPYLTARSLSMPLSLLSLCFTLDLLYPRHSDDPPRRAFLLLGLSLLLAALLHPLMAGYTLAAVGLLASLGARSRRLRTWGTLGLCFAALLLAALIQALTLPESASYQDVVATRYYWFPNQWHWYEQVGLIAPLAILAAILLSGRFRTSSRPVITPHARLILQTAITLGLLSCLIAACFSRQHLATHLVARLQPLRTFQTIYLLMILFLGALLAEHALNSRPWRWLTLILLAAAPIFYAQRATYPASLHLESPWRSSPNPWVRSFLWVRHNTPPDALFALNPHYITSDGEDAQTFRAIAERSTLPDYSKDGGEASITPTLSLTWSLAQSLQSNLDHQTDQQRRQSLLPRHVTWLILDAHSQTGLPCPYRNEAVQVCRLP